jgi:uncharacterized Zn-finger protein
MVRLTSSPSRCREELTMAETGVPHFHNEPGVPVVRVGSKEFMCIGAKPPFDHPHVFLDMGADSDIICPYCSTLYRFDAAIGAGHCVPAESEWHGEDKVKAA